jgi:hypothetical protein
VKPPCSYFGGKTAVGGRIAALLPPHEHYVEPFAGIGSEGVGALRNRRRFVGIELKPSYYRAAVRNLRAAENGNGQDSLFDLEAG